jgi:hypothetical protein
VAGPLLEVLAEERELTTAQAEESIALEGTLRDEVLGGRLGRPEIVAAAGYARRRGVDVVLLDDGDGVELSAADVARVAHWMTTHLNRVAAGRFVGRIPPEGGADLATIVVAEDAGPYRINLSR